MYCFFSRTFKTCLNLLSFLKYLLRFIQSTILNKRKFTINYCSLWYAFNAPYFPGMMVCCLYINI